MLYLMNTHSSHKCSTDQHRNRAKCAHYTIVAQVMRVHHMHGKRKRVRTENPAPYNARPSQAAGRTRRSTPSARAARRAAAVPAAARGLVEHLVDGLAGQHRQPAVSKPPHVGAPPMYRGPSLHVSLKQDTRSRAYTYGSTRTVMQNQKGDMCTSFAGSTAL